jgi:dTDP-4-amino-4,6-dideoxygalactose transaminase
VADRLLSVWPPLPPSAHLRRPADRLPFPLEEPTGRLYARARHGLWHGLHALGLTRGDEVLVPAYHHGSEIEPYLRAGVTCRLYDCTDSLGPDPAALARLVGPCTRALHLTHVLGLPQDPQPWRRWCDERGLLLVEDAAQAWLGEVDGRPLGSTGDLALFCLYKTLGLPDGAAAIWRGGHLPQSSRRRTGLKSLAARHALWLAGRSPAAARLPRLPAGTSYAADGEDGVGDPLAAPSRATAWTLRRLPTAGVAARRRAHYSRLAALLGERVPAGMRDPAPGASPFALPVEVDDNLAAVARLRDARIHALAFWRIPHPEVDVAGFPIAAHWRRRLVALPVHQELDEGDLARLASALERVG